MVNVPIDVINMNIFGFAIFPDVIENFVADVFSQIRVSVFGSPNGMNPYSDKWHIFEILD
jgi:hypothetical protein